MPHAEMAEVVKQLLDSQMVVRESAEALAFSHALTRDAAYATVLVRERKRLHRIIAETIEHETGEAHGTLGGRLGELAYHYYEADAWEQTLNYEELAGTGAQSVNAPREAVT